MGAPATNVDDKGRPSDDVARVEEAELKGYENPQPGRATALEIQARFDSLRDLSPEQMEALNKKVLKRIDWRLMPTLTIMFLLK